MKLSPYTKISALVAGDIIALYAALAVTLLMRYGGAAFASQAREHLFPFSLIFGLWIVVFYVMGLYDLRRLRNNLDFFKILAVALLANAAVTIAIFYLVPLFGITPKTTLFLFLVVFALIEAWWRRTFNVRASFREGLIKVLLLGESAGIREIVHALKDNPQIGYEIKAWVRQGFADPGVGDLLPIVKKHDINLIVVPRSIKKDPTLSKVFYELLASGLEIMDVPSFYEEVFRKVPLSELEEAWFLEHHIGERKFYDDFKRGISLATAIFLAIVLLPLMFLIALLITLTSPGPSICTQTRVGKHNQPYAHFKFRTMKSCKEKEGPQWATPGDERITAIGKILRRSHLDELPQLMNIIKGDLAFVGPRPERPEFVTMLEEKIPYYEIRHLVKPGVAGWAQVNFRYGASIEDAEGKLEYDIYYLKNRSLILDVAIILKTLRTLFVTPK